MTVPSALGRCPPIAGSLTLKGVGTLITWPYTAGGRSRRGSPKAGTTMETSGTTANFTMNNPLRVISTSGSIVLHGDQVVFRCPVYGDVVNWDGPVGSERGYLFFSINVTILQQPISFLHVYSARDR